MKHLSISVDRAQEDVLHQDLVNLHQIQGVQYQDDEFDSDEEFRRPDSVCSDYDDKQFLEDFKEHDWASTWHELGMDEHKFKVTLTSSIQIIQIECKYN